MVSINMKINEKNLIAYSHTREHIDKEGYLFKRVEGSKSFQKRWCVLKGNLLFYFEKKNDKEPQGVIILEGCTIELAENEEYYVFKIVFYGTNSRVYEFSTDSQTELEIWMRIISRSSYDYLKIMVLELQKQVEEIEGMAKCGTKLPPLPVAATLKSHSTSVFRENPFNNDRDVSFRDIWKCDESLQNASSLLSKVSPPSLGVNVCSTPNIPFRPAPPPPVPSPMILTSEKGQNNFFDIHKSYGQRILQDRDVYIGLRVDNLQNRTSCPVFSSPLEKTKCVKEAVLIHL